ncbi:hypothetical protein Q7P37_007779 [Cladosporium fusiforme]
MAARPPTTKRTTTASTTLPAARPPCKIHPTAIIADKAQFTGSFPVEIAEHAVIHPYARIRAEYGSVKIGSYCIVSECAVVGLPEGQEGEVALDSWVNIESGAEVLASHVGEGTEVGIQAKIGVGATVGKYCRLTATEVVQDREQVRDFTVIFGDGKRRVDKTLVDSVDVRSARIKGQERHVDALKRLVPDAKAKWIS